VNTHRPHIPTAKYTPAPSHVKPPSQSVLEKKEVDVTPPVSSRHHTQNSGKAAPRDKTPIKKQSTAAAVAPSSKKSKSPEKVIPKRPASPAKTVEKKRDEKGKRKEDEKKAKKEATKEKKDSSERKAASPSK
jgi:hypothetical protein